MRKIITLIVILLFLAIIISPTMSYIISFDDTTPPEITNVCANPNNQSVCLYVNITCDVTDDVEVDFVNVVITYPDGDIFGFRMHPSYYFNRSYLSQIGTYSYYIWAFDTSGNDNISDNYTFEIINHPPYVQNLNPPNGATNVTGCINWTGGDPDPCYGVTYDVYFGLSNPPTKMYSNITFTFFDPPGQLEPFEIYYWQIVAWDYHGASTEGPIWSFTIEVPPPPEIKIVNPKEGYFHFSGIPLFPTSLDILANTVSFGGFRLRPIQVNGTNGSPDGDPLMVRLFINDEDKGLGIWNPDTGCYEWEWTGWALGEYILRFRAKDVYGQNIEEEIIVWNFCFIP